MAESAKLVVSAVSAILVNPRGEVLLQLRDDRPGLSFPGHWTLFGGKVEAGESALSAIQRELAEELGRSADVRLWRVYRRPHNDAVDIEQHIFVAKIDWPIEDVIVMEGQGAGYFSLEQLGDLPVAFGFREALEAFFNDAEVYWA